MKSEDEIKICECCGYKGPGFYSYDDPRQGDIDNICPECNMADAGVEPERGKQ